jgi:hypothetical protein
MRYLISRGFSKEVIDQYGLGWYGGDEKVDPALWDVELEEGKRFWIPRGWVIPGDTWQ